VGGGGEVTAFTLAVRSLTHTNTRPAPLALSTPAAARRYKAGIFDAMHPWNGHYGSWTADGSWTVGPMVRAPGCVWGDGGAGDARRLARSPAAPLSAHPPHFSHPLPRLQVWATAHTTQFTAPGWLYTLIGNGPGTGSGNLAVGGTYVSLVDPTGTQFTMVRGAKEVGRGGGGAAWWWRCVAPSLTSAHLTRPPPSPPRYLLLPRAGD
jgi:hypothetical protein